MIAYNLQSNLVLGWLWVLLGFITGMVLGLFFQGETWLGGYTSLRRRMYRLGHISFFGLGAVNLLFWLTVKALSASSEMLTAASWLFVAGAVTMPVCCVLMAHFPKLHLIFSVPVVSLIAGGVLMLLALGGSAHPATARAAGNFSLTPTFSRWERGRRLDASQISLASSTKSVAQSRTNRRTILPLPAGEGRGEGEYFEVQSSLLSRTSNQFQPNNLNLFQP